jgi:hypothetical protein
MKFLFLPFSIVGGLIAGAIGSKIFDAVWGLIDDQEPPEPEHRDISGWKMIAALALEGAIFRATRGLADHAARRSFERATGRWPGETAPQPE